MSSFVFEWGGGWLVEVVVVDVKVIVSKLLGEREAKHDERGDELVDE